MTHIIYTHDNQGDGYFSRESEATIRYWAGKCGIVGTLSQQADKLGMVVFKDDMEAIWWAFTNGHMHAYNQMIHDEQRIEQLLNRTLSVQDMMEQAA